MASFLCFLKASSVLQLKHKYLPRKFSSQLKLLATADRCLLCDFCPGTRGEVRMEQGRPWPGSQCGRARGYHNHQQAIFDEHPSHYDDN